LKDTLAAYSWRFGRGLDLVGEQRMHTIIFSANTIFCRSFHFLDKCDVEQEFRRPFRRLHNRDLIATSQSKDDCLLNYHGMQTWTRRTRKRRSTPATIGHTATIMRATRFSQQSNYSIPSRLRTTTLCDELSSTITTSGPVVTLRQRNQPRSKMKNKTKSPQSPSGRLK